MRALVQRVTHARVTVPDRGPMTDRAATPSQPTATARATPTAGATATDGGTTTDRATPPTRAIATAPASTTAPATASDRAAADDRASPDAPTPTNQTTERVTGEIGHGLLVFLGVEKDDGPADLEYVVSKIRELRIFEDDGDAEGRRRMNRSVVEIGGSVLVVSQFTLAGDVRRGRRPSFDAAAPPDVAREYYENVVRKLRESGLTVATGEFQAMMRVQLENDGPVTILIDSRRRF